jgi:predicted nucleic acid-binding protein
MKSVFADTSFFIAFLVAHDQHFAQAHEFAEAYTRWLVTTTGVLTEAANFLARSRLRKQLVETVDELRTNPHVEVVAESPELWDRAFNLYAARPDKSWSLTDCLSFVVMQDRGLTEALTADRHFEQAGFEILLK